MNRRRFLSATALVLAAAACGDDDPTEPVYSDPLTAVYASELNVGDIRTMQQTQNGTYYRERTVGTGTTATTASTVTVTYAGYVPTGRRFDAGTAQFPLSGVIAGFREGIAGMRVGGERLLVIPPAAGYGSNPPDGSRIPPNSVLVFTVRLNSVP